MTARPPPATPVDHEGRRRALTPGEIRRVREYRNRTGCLLTEARDAVLQGIDIAPRSAPETPATCDYCRGVGACPRCWGRAAIEELKAKATRPPREEVERAAHDVFMEGYHEGRGEGAAGEAEVVAALLSLLGFEVKP